MTAMGFAGLAGLAGLIALRRRKACHATETKCAGQHRESDSPSQDWSVGLAGAPIALRGRKACHVTETKCAGQQRASDSPSQAATKPLVVVITTGGTIAHSRCRAEAR